MPFTNSLKTWMTQIRAPFLLLAVFLVAIGGAAAHHDGIFNPLRFFLCMIGIVLTHIAVNLCNELSDYRTGIDQHTRRTPFSGGSGSLQAGKTTYAAVRSVAIASLAVAAIIGCYLGVVSGPLVFFFMIAGGLTIVSYTPRLARWGFGEAAAGLCLGSFVVAGAYYAMAGTLSAGVLVASVPPGILTALLLFLNEFPDVEADRAGGRRHLVIRLGYRGAATLYAIAIAVTYLVIVAGVCFRLLPAMLLLGCLTIPLAIKVSIEAFRSGNLFEKFIPTMGMNVLIVLGTDLLLAAAYILS